MKKLTPVNKNSGFTLIEVLVSMTIIAILAAIGVGGFQYVTEKKDRELANLQINLLSVGLEDYKFDYGVYPGGEDAGGTTGSNQSNMLFQSLYWDTDDDGEPVTDEEGNLNDTDQTIYISELDPNNNGQDWIEGFEVSSSSATIVDPWGNEYRYRVGSGAINPDFDLWSAGPDGETSTTGTGGANDADNIGNF